MRPAHGNGDHLNQLAAIRHDEGLTELLRIHLAGSEAGARTDDTAPPRLMPALLGRYLDLDSIRYDFPVVLVDDPGGAPAVPLARVVDAALAQATATGAQADDLRRRAYRLESLVRELAVSSPRRRLSELWALAAERFAKRAGLDAVGAALGHDGRLLSCDPSTPRRVFEHAWGQLQSERARDERGVLEALVARLSEVLESERARSPRSDSPQALEAALGGEHAGGIDFEAFSSLLRSTRHRRVSPVKRVKRLRAARRVLVAELALLPEPAGNGAHPRRARRHASVCDSCAGAKARFDAELRRRVDLFRALRTARLELENHYREERHDRYFAAFGPAQFSTEEYRAAPPLLVFLDGDALGDAEKATLVDILGSDMPVKVVLEIHELPVSDPAGAPPGTFTGWTRQIAPMAASLGEPFVVQTAASHLPVLAPQIAAGLRRAGPALFCVYAGPARARDAVPTYLRCASAVESRAFPSFVCDPERGAGPASRLSLAGSPQPGRDWPEHPFDYEAPDGQAATETLRFTCVDFLLLDPRFAHHFVPVPRPRWHANMVPIARYLELSRAERMDKVPFVHALDAEGRAHRVVVGRALVTHARKCLAAWRALRETAGAGEAREVPRGGPEASPVAGRQAAPEVADGSRAAQSAPAPDAAAPPEAAPAPPAAARPPDGEAWIESDLCTSCDDCTRRNAAMFAYNDAKQAFIRDATAGTYRELVEAAENCPVCIIHPGRPQDPGEPGLGELEKRARPFN